MFMTVDKVTTIATNIMKKGLDEIQRLIDKNGDDISSLREQLSSLQKTVDELNHLRDRKDSDEPWFEFVGGEVHPEHGLELRLDWNDAFIEQLKRQGYKGTSDDEIIAQYVANVQKTIEGRE